MRAIWCSSMEGGEGGKREEESFVEVERGSVEWEQLQLKKGASPLPMLLVHCATFFLLKL